jgi:thymidylate synthase
MAHLVTANRAASAWRKGATLLLDVPGCSVNNLITEIADGTYCEDEWLGRFNPQAVGAADSLSVVAKVLFPSSPKRPGESRDAYYARWTHVLQRSREAGKLKSAWGSTYFERLLSLGGSENQIERAIRALRQWPQRYEAAIVMHTSSPLNDGLRTRGSPCLQFIELLWHANGRIDLVAVYRNHDFLSKSLGNFIGLGRLLRFVCAEAGKTPGKVVCHSVKAYASSPAKLRRLVAR